MEFYRDETGAASRDEHLAALGQLSYSSHIGPT